MEKKANHSIQCTVTPCAYHCKSKNYCSRNSIQVGTHEQNPTVTECTDCQSFVLE